MALDMGGGTKEEDMVIKEESMVAIKDMLLGTMVAVIIITVAEWVLGNGIWPLPKSSMLEIFSSMSKNKISRKHSRALARF